MITFYINCFLSASIVTISIIGDRLLASAPSRIIKALADNSTHGLVSLFCGGLVLMNTRTVSLTMSEKGILLLMSYAIGSGIDVDHFIAAKSINLRAATSLSNRPWLHCSTIPAILVVPLLIFPRSSKLLLWTLVAFNAFATHHIRDGTRRGLWFVGFGHTKPIPYNFYLVLEVLVPFLAIFITKISWIRMEASDSYQKLTQIEHV